MGELRNWVNPLHRATTRDYIGRMNDEKIHCMLKAKEYEYDYWDGDRRYGYGGYRYIDDRWKRVAQPMIDAYGLKSNARILDIGCGKAYLLYELKQLLPDAEIVGIDISKHGLADAKPEIRDALSIHRAQDPLPFEDDHFDLVISLATVHNLRIFELKQALQEIERVGRNKYLMTESYNNEAELFNLQCWALTCESFFDTEEWVWLFKQFGYTGDYEFITFE